MSRYEIIDGSSLGVVVIVFCSCCFPSWRFDPLLDSWQQASTIGGMKNTQAVMDLCAKHNIYPEIKVIPVWEINNVFERLDNNNDSGERYVIDIQVFYL